MLREFFKKQKKISHKKIVVRALIEELKISDQQKATYIQSLDILDDEGLENLYQALQHFIEDYESVEDEKRLKDNF